VGTAATTHPTRSPHLPATIVTIADMLDREQKPMLAKLVRMLPEGEFAYEPKWDGFRCLVFRDGGEIDLRSRHGLPLARYFPELTRALVALEPARLALDGEVLVLEPAPSTSRR